ncbi:Serine/arginine-rich splicing factor 6 [Homalodisca vitripennis]|nr:Serine/arginine-rich splicing factor 6 [Homalodisca vitripennis]
MARPRSLTLYRQRATASIVLRGGRSPLLLFLGEFDDHRDADDAVYELNGKELLGERVIVELARGTARRSDRSFGGSSRRRSSWYGKVSVEKARGTPRGSDVWRGSGHGRSLAPLPRRPSRARDREPDHRISDRIEIAIWPTYSYRIQIDCGKPFNQSQLAVKMETRTRNEEEEHQSGFSCTALYHLNWKTWPRPSPTFLLSANLILEVVELASGPGLVLGRTSIRSIDVNPPTGLGHPPLSCAVVVNSVIPGQSNGGMLSLTCHNNQLAHFYYANNHNSGIDVCTEKTDDTLDYSAMCCCSMSQRVYFWRDEGGGVQYSLVCRAWTCPCVLQK